MMLEDTLIDLYLTRSSQENVNPESLSTSKSNDFHQAESECFQIEEHDELQRSLLAEDVSRVEENWLAQYGQVVQSDDENITQLAVVDLWDWEMVTESKRKGPISRLVGRLVKRSNKMHQSLPAASSLLKTAAISEVHLDLVRVVSGKIYRLRNPGSKYLASLSTYDASNPTRTWGFPDLYSRLDRLLPEASTSNCQSTKKVAKSVDEPSSMSEFIEIIADNDQNQIYRDRAAERRKLHGGSVIGPGHKQVRQDREDSTNAETSVTEITITPFTSESIARKILESMGWKDGQALGSSRKGILEPIQAIGNKGSAGLGWNNTRITS